MSKIKTYKDLVAYDIDWKNQIPKIIFKSGRKSVEDLEYEIKNLYEKEIELNPEYTLFYFDDVDCEKFILDTKDNFLINSYQSLIPSAYKSDLWRLSVLFYYGGIYTDFSMQSLIPYNEIVKSGYEHIFVKDMIHGLGIYNAFMASIRRSELIKRMIDAINKNVILKYKGENPLDITGPNLIGKEYKKFYNVSELFLGHYTHKNYMYKIEEKNYISDVDNTKILKCRLENHYEILYGEKINRNLLGSEYRPLNHYSRLWVDNNIFR